MSAFIVGLTGGIGSGKTTVADLFAAQGVVVVDTDRIAHELTAPGGEALPGLVAAFGPEVLDGQGAMDRKRMRERVFADDAARSRLEGILHPLIYREALQQCRAAASPYVLLAVPLLVETGRFLPLCQRVLVIDCPESVQISRVMARSRLDAGAVQAMLAAQASREARRAVADDILCNDGGIDALYQPVADLHRRYLAMAQEKHATSD